MRVLTPGDINAEGVDVRNNGAVVDVTGWMLSDGAGHTYTFPQQRLFQGSLLTIYTRADSDTPTAKFWGLDTAHLVVRVDAHAERRQRTGTVNLSSPVRKQQTDGSD